MENGHQKIINTKAIFWNLLQEWKQDFPFLVKNEIDSVGSVKMHFTLPVEVSTTQDNKLNGMEHCFCQRDPAILDRNNETKTSGIFNNFIDQMNGKIEAWSLRG